MAPRSERQMLEDNAWFQAWMAFVFLGFIACLPILVLTDGEGWGHVALLVAMAPAGLSIAGFMLGLVGVILLVIAEPFLPDPPAVRIPTRDLRDPGRKAA